MSILAYILDSTYWPKIIQRSFIRKARDPLTVKATVDLDVCLMCALAQRQGKGVVLKHTLISLKSRNCVYRCDKQWWTIGK